MAKRYSFMQRTSSLKKYFSQMPHQIRNIMVWITCAGTTCAKNASRLFRVRLMQLLGDFFLSFDDFCQRSQGLIYRVMIRENFGNIGFNNYNICPLSISLCIFSPNASAEIIFFKHVRIFRHLLHIKASWVISDHYSCCHGAWQYRSWVLFLIT